MGNKTTVWDISNYLGVFPIKKTPTKQYNISPVKIMAVLIFTLLDLELGPKYLGLMLANVPQQATTTELRLQLLPSDFITSLSSSSSCPDVSNAKKPPNKPHQKQPQNYSSQPQKDPYSLRVSVKFKTARRTRQLQQHPNEPCKGPEKIPSWPSALLSSVSHDRRDKQPLPWPYILY